MARDEAIESSSERERLEEAGRRHEGKETRKSKGERRKEGGRRSGEKEQAEKERVKGEKRDEER